VGFTRRPERLSLVVVAAFLLLMLGVTGASAAPKTNKGTSRTIGTCTVITHPTAARHTVCVEANLQTAPLSHADLSYAVLTGAKLNNADLAGANLTQANLTKAVLSGANLAGVTWSGTTCPDGTNSNEAGDSCSGHLSTTASTTATTTTTTNAPNIPVGPDASLPFTGFDPWPFALTGAALIAIGVVLLELARALGRRRSRPQTS
jgi:Pentapeptide repeats (8 copies)